MRIGARQSDGLWDIPAGVVCLAFLISWKGYGEKGEEF